jgi:hypothetical protein
MSLASWVEVDTGHFDFSRRGDITVGPASNAGKSRRTLELEKDWREWLEVLFPGHVSRGFGEHHETFWEWLWEIETDSDPAPFIGIWARGGGKSTSLELGAVAIGARGKRPYLIYLRDTQERADDSVANIGKLLTSEGIERQYPDCARPQLGKFGRPDGWRRNRLRTASGFTVDALGLDVAQRGIKLEADRPGVIFFDDVDGRHDSETRTKKKLATISESLLPAGTDNAAIAGVQNLIIPDGVFSRLADGRADFLSGRIVSGPHPAIEDLEVEEHSWPDGRLRHVITGGRPTWAGQDRKACQRLLDRIGLESFMRECQHEVATPPGALVYSQYADAMRRGDLVSPSREAEQFLGIDPGFAKRACMLAIQERADRAEMWKEWSFVRCDDDYIAKIAAKHCLAWRVRTVYHDSESPELGAAIRKQIRLLYAEHRERTGEEVPHPRVDSVAFNKYKRLAIKATRWLLRLGAASWGALVTERHEGEGDDYEVSEVPGVFRWEVERYKLVPGTDDEAEKENDHGPDAWHAYAARWIKEMLAAEKEADEEPGD